MILVTGGTGLVGAYLLLKLAEYGVPIRAIYRCSDSTEKTKNLFFLHKKENLFNIIEWVKADITDISALEIAFQDIEYVYHCAGLISYDPKDEIILRKTNIEGTANIVNFCIEFKIKKICYVSSIAALGDIVFNEEEITEKTEWNPESQHSDYAISKYGAEIELWRGQQEGLNFVIVNPGIILGAGFWNQGSGLFFSAIKNGFPFYTHGSTGYVGVTDVVTIMIQLMNSSFSGERYTIVANNMTFKEIIFKIANDLNVPKPKIHAKIWMTSLAWRLDWLRSAFLGSKRKLSKYSANALHAKEFISNEKIKTALNFKFQDIDSVIKTVISLQNN